MRLNLSVFFTLFMGTCFMVSGQVSPDCATAIPICSNTPVSGGVQGYGDDDFGGAATSGCLELTLSGNIESNSAWYRFRTAASGQLGFNIGFDPSEDWDFALYQASDCGDLGEPIRCNFFDNQDQEAYMGVGEDPNGNPDTYLYEAWLEVNPGEDYYLLINNFSNNNTGFSIQFTGQIFEAHPFDALDCSIVDNLLGPPVAGCEGSAEVLDATTPGAVAYQWFMDTGAGFAPIPGESGPTLQAAISALYRVRVMLADGSQRISDVQVGFSPAPQSFPLAAQGFCGTLEPPGLHAFYGGALGPQDPSDFRVSYHLSQAEAQAGTNALPADWVPATGTQTVYYRVTSLENPNCYAAEHQFELTALPVPRLDFPVQAYICSEGGSVVIGQPSPEAGVSYLWDTGEQAPSIWISAPGVYTLTASRTEAGEVCEVSRTVEVVRGVAPAIAEITIDDLSASNQVTVVPREEGPFEYALNDGPYQGSPVFTGVPAGIHQLHMRSTQGCGSLSETITVVGFGTLFTPNGDGLNDLWQITGLEQLTDPEIFIFDRYGKLLKQLDATSAGWDGTFNGRQMPATDYWFRLNYTNEQGQRVEARYLKTHFSLVR
jgi:gliding motility-associated-like protein